MQHDVIQNAYPPLIQATWPPSPAQVVVTPAPSTSPVIVATTNPPSSFPSFQLVAQPMFIPQPHSPQVGMAPSPHVGMAPTHTPAHQHDPAKQQTHLHSSRRLDQPFDLVDEPNALFAALNKKSLDRINNTAAVARHRKRVRGGNNKANADPIETANRAVREIQALKAVAEEAAKETVCILSRTRALAEAAHGSANAEHHAAATNQATNKGQGSVADGSTQRLVNDLMDGVGVTSGACLFVNLVLVGMGPISYLMQSDIPHLDFELSAEPDASGSNEHSTTLN